MLQLDHVNVFYGESHILRNVSFAVEAGQVVCLMGRNGVGKTTTLKTIMGLLQGQLFGVAPTDPVTHVTVVIAIVAVSAVAAWLPARRAAGVAPSEALRTQ